MTAQEITELQKEFHLIVNQVQWLKTEDIYIRNLHNWDKNGSHKSAILKATDKRREDKKTLDVCLKGKTYEEWKAFAKKITVLKSKLKNSEAARDRAIKRFQDIQKEFTSLKF